MYAFMEFITGPMVWISFILCGLGLIVRTLSLIMLARKKESFIFRFLSFKYGFRSLFVWMIPYLPKSARNQPVFYGVSYLFHIFLISVPLLLLAHITLFEESFNVSWWGYSDTIADVLTVLVIIALIFFAVRRVIVAEVKFLTDWTDYAFILLVAAPFITGFIAYHQFFAYRWMVIFHILSSELVIILIPFTRLFHMILAPFSRAYTGSEFGGVRHAKDW